jgi:mannan endo-1,4-beta-mannosidase
MILIKSNSVFVFLLAVIVSCNATAQSQLPADKNATAETVKLYGNLKKLAAKGFMFGHQDDLAYGVNWKYEKDRSDVKDVTGDYPAVYGWDLGNLENADNSNNIDGVPFNKMKKFIKEGYERGGVITISWHLKSPFGYPKGAWDTTHGTVTSVLPGGANNELFKEWLDKAAGYFLSLKGSKGELIPVLFRPYHELTGNWFWWCKNACSEEEFKTLWRYTVYYLKEVKKVHNLLYVYNVADFDTKEDLLKRYPGDDVVDMISFDSYQYNDPAKDDGFLKMIDKRLTVLERVAAEKNKLFAFGETGYEAIPYPTWWTDVLLKAIGDHKISYVLVWRNHGYNEYMKKMHYYAPYKGQVSEPDFIKFYNKDNTLFEKDALAAKLYQ